MRVELLRGAALADPAAVDYRDAIGQRERLVLVVGDEERCRPGLPEHAAHVLAQARPQARVERRERLVQQHERRRYGESPGKGDALLLASRKLVREAPLEAAQPDHFQQLGHPFATPLASRQAEPDILHHRQVREQAPVLRHETDPAPIRRNVVISVVDELTAKLHGTAVGAFEACDHSEQRRLTAARRPEDGGERSGHDREVETV